MTTMTDRPYVGESDLVALVELLNACEEIDQLDEGTTIDELRRALAEPGRDPARDYRLWQEADGTLVGFGKTRFVEDGEQPEGFLEYNVHPIARASALATQIIAWGEDRVREMGRTWAVPTVRMVVAARDDHPQELALQERHGFAATRSFVTMEHSLAESIPAPHFPDGFVLRSLAGEHELPAWVELYNQSFIDHWNHHPLTVDRALHRRQSNPHYQFKRDLVAVTSDGTFAAFCACSVNPDENQRSGRDEGWINLVGTRRGFRNRGLGRAMLLSGMRHLADDGATTVLLGVDSENPSGANRLYESVGFRPRYAWVIQSKQVQTADRT